MNTSVTVLVFLASSLIFLVAVKGDLIETTCKSTPSPDLCTTTLRSDPSGATATDAATLVRIIMNADLTKANNTLNQIHVLLKKTLNVDVDRALAFCAETYRPIVMFDIPQAIDALVERHFKFANDGIEETGNQVDSCDKKVTGSVKIPEVSDMNKVVRNLSAVASSILNTLSG